MTGVRNRIRPARQLAGLTQAELARRAGTTQSAIAAYESGARIPEHATLMRILHAAQFRPSKMLRAKRSEVLDALRAHKATNVRVFGSIGRGEDQPDSDIDLLCDFAPDASSFDVVEAQWAVEAVLGVDVDLVSSGGLRLPKHRQLLAEATEL